MPKKQEVQAPLPEPKPSLGETPAKLAKRELFLPNQWCPKPNLEFDSWCDPLNPKTITFKDICKAANFISKEIPKSPMRKSKCCSELGMNLYYKLELFHKTSSYHERGAFYALSMLTKEQCDGGIYSSSAGNWALAISYHAQKLKLPINLILPVTTQPAIVEKCGNYGATVILLGNNVAESRKHALMIIADCGIGTYINGYDHPHVIAGAGSIGLEILEQCPDLDAVLVSVGGGGLIAGVATAIKQKKPNALIYGFENKRSCCFYKALDNGYPYLTAASTASDNLNILIAGYNAFNTAKSIIDKMVLVQDEWIARAILHMLEKENLATEASGVSSLSAFFAIPNILPELQNKNVVCVISGGNIDIYTFIQELYLGREVEGRIIKMNVTVEHDDTSLKNNILRLISHVGGNVLDCTTGEASWSTGTVPALPYTNISYDIEMENLSHARTLKRLAEKLFPGVVEFLEEPFSPIPTCHCFPQLLP